MQQAGSVSWRFAEAVAGISHAVLYVRDTVGLLPPAGPDIPPRLSGDLPDRRGVLEDEEREEASAQWPDWWRAAIACEIREHENHATGPYQRLEEFQKTADPPEFTSLAGRPALRKAAQATFVEGNRWAAERRREFHDGGGLPAFDWRSQRRIAEQVARRHGVSLGKVRGSAVLLMVQGKWWARIGPGLIACSLDAAADPHLAASIVEAAFDSGITS